MPEMKLAQALGPLNDVEAKYAPEALYLEGDAALLSDAPRVAIVGSRQASAEGLRRVSKLVRQLVDEGVTIVSGLALGVDTRAHTAAIEAGGRTIAVLGTPLDRSYPRENRELQALIAREHLLVSQFPSGHTTQRWDFPKRNRTMALISNATVIVEAAEKSGTISQAWEALRLGRPLFIMQSLLDSGLEWPRSVLDYGAWTLSEETLPDLLLGLPRRLPDLSLAG